ncbi:MAG: sugar transferase [Bacteroidia bacterium]|nr:sugar transferase [Bacteroidia bacterium]
MNKRLQTTTYIISDFIAGSISWALFYILRKVFIESAFFGYQIEIVYDKQFYLGLIFIPFFWVLLNYLSGYYKDIYRRSRLKELGQTITISIVGVVIIFFVVILDDYIFSYKNYYRSILMLFGLQFTITYLPRLFLTTRIVHRIQNRKFGFNTLLIGSNRKALDLYEEMEAEKKSAGNRFIGFVSVTEKSKYLLDKNLKCLGNINNLPKIIDEYKIEEVIIAIETSEHDQINFIINKIDNKNLVVKVIPTLYDILTGSVRMTSLYSAPLIQISRDLMPEWQLNIKRLLDILFSIIAIIILIPVYIFLVIGVKLSSSGPILYTHERIGRYGKPFKIYKFRSMYVNAEKNGPALSSDNDSRITKFGKFMRKIRLDEVPQFFNVIFGDMSLVGPRPERQYFIDQIIKEAPHYSHLQKVRPGITSWGQVKFGYAENVEEMIERLKYDLIYIENMSLYIDFKIMIYTVKIILQRSGK